MVLHEDSSTDNRCCHLSPCYPSLELIQGTWDIVTRASVHNSCHDEATQFQKETLNRFLCGSNVNKPFFHRILNRTTLFTFIHNDDDDSESWVTSSAATFEPFRLLSIFTRRELNYYNTTATQHTYRDRVNKFSCYLLSRSIRKAKVSFIRPSPFSVVFDFYYLFVFI